MQCTARQQHGLQVASLQALQLHSELQSQGYGHFLFISSDQASCDLVKPGVPTFVLSTQVQLRALQACSHLPPKPSLPADARTRHEALSTSRSVTSQAATARGPARSVGH